jgi:hypothetical protein
MISSTHVCTYILNTRTCAGSSAANTVGQLLVRFDEAWLRYLDQFAAWKLADAASLEAELVGVGLWHFWRLSWWVLVCGFTGG